MKRWMALLLCMAMLWISAEAETTTKVDIDLSIMNNVMFTGELNQMYMDMDMDAYMGKIIRMSGCYYAYAGFDEQGNVDPDVAYHVCQIADAPACCVQGVEFILADGIDYPEPGTWITVVGTFDTYEEYGYLHFHLTDALLEL